MAGSSPGALPSHHYGLPGHAPITTEQVQPRNGFDPVTFIVPELANAPAVQISERNPTRRALVVYNSIRNQGSVFLGAKSVSNNQASPELGIALEPGRGCVIRSCIDPIYATSDVGTGNNGVTVIELMGATAPETEQPMTVDFFGQRRLSGAGMGGAVDVVDVNDRYARLLGKVNMSDAAGDPLSFLLAGLSTWSVPVADATNFITESTTALGSSATFTGPLRDTFNYNWAGLKSNADQAGTLFLDESDASSGSPIMQVATQASAASPATHGAPGTFVGQEARIAPTKTVDRFIRAVYVNGATAQTVFRLDSATSPLN